jgi:hypothetical protein
VECITLHFWAGPLKQASRRSKFRDWVCSPSQSHGLHYSTTVIVVSPVVGADSDGWVQCPSHTRSEPQHFTALTMDFGPLGRGPEPTKAVGFEGCSVTPLIRWSSDDMIGSVWEVSEA